MANSEKHPIRNGIIATVVGGVIVSGLLYLIPKLLAFLQKSVSAIWGYFLSKTLIPNSLLCLLVILAISTILGIAKYIFRKKLQQTTDEVSLDSYKADNLFGLTWKWSSILDGNPSKDLWCFCPKCATRLVYRNDSPYRISTPEMVFFCENCKFQSLTFDGTIEYIMSKVARQIEKRVNTGEWKDVIKSSREQLLSK